MSGTTPRFFLALIALAISANSAAAEQVKITIENLQPNDGFYFTPVWLGFHDGGFDLYDAGSAASSQLESVAETGDVGPLRTLFGLDNNGDGTSRFDTVAFALGGFDDPPVFDAGESVSMIVDVSDPASNRYLSLASMVIPSNDAFFGNDNPMQYEVFGADGSFAGPITFEFTGADIYDAGTEVNNAQGAAFSAIGGVDSAEGGLIALSTGLDNFIGTGTAAGTTIGSGIGAGELLGRVQVTAVPEPSNFALGILAALSLLIFRRRKRAK